MDIGKLNNWLQLAAAIGVIAGLGLVAYELRQQHQLVRSELASETFNAFQQAARSLQDGAVAAAYTKSLSAPETLSDEELVILNAFYTEVITAYFFRQEYFVSRGFFDIERSRIGVQGAALLFAGEHGKAWWAENRMGVPRLVRDILDGHAAQADGLPIPSDIRKISEQASQ